MVLTGANIELMFMRLTVVGEETVVMFERFKRTNVGLTSVQFLLMLRNKSSCFIFVVLSFMGLKIPKYPSYTTFFTLKATQNSIA